MAVSNGSKTVLLWVSVFSKLEKFFFIPTNKQQQTLQVHIDLKKMVRIVIFIFSLLSPIIFIVYFFVLID